MIMKESYENDGNFFKGLFWGATLSVPLWLSFFGWVKLILEVIK
jgi:hypothetical protein